MACSDTDYEYLRQLVLSHSANVVDPSRNALFESRLAPLAQRAGAVDLGDFVDLLRIDRSTQLHRAVAEAMTISETSFFRDGKPFDLLRNSILPVLIARNQKSRRLRLWSAASSTGQEAYSLAMLICEYFPELIQWDVKIVGTDISRTVVDTAKRGRYRRLDVNRGLPARMLVKYFERDGEEWEIKRRLREMCDFQCVNLCKPLAALPQFDLALLRNVLLYFPQRDRTSVFGEVHRQIVPDGYLLLGNAEQAEDSTKLFVAEFAGGCYFYRPVPGS